MKKVLVIYHREDNDGCCAAGIVAALLDSKGINDNTYGFDEMEFKGVSYADLSREWEEMQNYDESSTDHRPLILRHNWEHVFMVDISFNNIDAMNFLYERYGERFHWCDHHKPIIDLSKDQPFGNAKGVRNMDQSALMNTWEYLTDYEPSIWMTQLSDYDSWSWTRSSVYQNKQNYEDLMSLNTGITKTSGLKVKWFFNWIGELLAGNRAEHDKMAHVARELGRVIWAEDQARCQRAINTHGDTAWKLQFDWGHRNAIALITTDHFNSLSFEMFRDSDIENAIVFKMDPKNDKVVMSLYNVNNDDNFDCGAFCKERYGGGGHKGAAGCTLTREQFIMMFQLKVI